MNMKNEMAPVHPGEILREELRELGMSARALARAINVPVNRITAILNGERGITADTALRLGRYFDTSTEVWMNLQKDYEIRQAERNDVSNVLHEIIPRQTVLLRDAVREINANSHFAPTLAETMTTISSNLTLCTQLQKIEKSLRLGERSREWLHALLGSLGEISEGGVFDSKLNEHLPCTFESFRSYKKQFKSPSVLECKRLEEEFAKHTDVAFDPPHPVLKNLDCAWLNESAEFASMQRIVELQYIANTVLRSDTFSSRCSDSLRTSLGDWRDQIDWPIAIWEDLSARVDFYEVLGFDVNLTDLPSSAYNEILEFTEIKSNPPDLIEAYDVLVRTSQNPDSEPTLARTNNASDWLHRLESQLRRFIDCKMTRAFGIEWEYQQLPKAMVRKWEDRKEAVEEAGTPTRPLVTYADFSDYTEVLCQGDRWDLVFERMFESRAIVRESLQRLYPIRNDTTYGRPITQDDELLLYVETKRLMNMIQSAS